jgi:hypothetical protein
MAAQDDFKLSVVTRLLHIVHRVIHHPEGPEVLQTWRFSAVVFGGR